MLGAAAPVDAEEALLSHAHAKRGRAARRSDITCSDLAAGRFGWGHTPVAKKSCG